MLSGDRRIGLREAGGSRGPILPSPATTDMIRTSVPRSRQPGLELLKFTTFDSVCSNDQAWV